MPSSINYTKSKIDLKNFNIFKNIIEVNPKLIIDVNEKKKYVVVATGGGSLDAMSFDDESWWKALGLLEFEIKTRTNPEDRSEAWECLDENGFYNFEIELGLLDLRKNIEPRQKKHYDKRALKELCNANNVPELMGALFLNELKLSQSVGDEKAKGQARMLGLMA